MAVDSLKVIQSTSVVGLNTYTKNIEVAGSYSVNVESFVTPPSGLTITINHNGSPIETATVLAATQQFLGCTAIIPGVAISDTITVVFTSSNMNDLSLNNIKSIVNLELI